MLAALLTCLLLSAPPTAEAAPPTKARPSLESEVVGPCVGIGDGARVYGTGTVIDLGGTRYVLTAAHVVEGEKHVWVSKRSADGKRKVMVEAETVAYSPYSGGRDLALLKLSSDLGVAPARFCPAPKLKLGEPCWYCGNPRGLDCSLERSIVNKAAFHSRGTTWTVVNGNGWYGHSGSGLYVRRGGHYVLVGVVSHLQWVDARAPVGCASPENVARFLDEFQKTVK